MSKLAILHREILVRNAVRVNELLSHRRGAEPFLRRYLEFYRTPPHRKVAGTGLDIPHELVAVTPKGEKLSRNAERQLGLLRHGLSRP